ncbi:glycosyltransferase family 2 protein [Agrobacterium tumefaciens]|uniref:glycosyltransferase family 2 protein n=1 Tax=Agrobacterium tumefaciens complex TaxID=1183400 RepID=UPI000FBD7970|nr:glycosyltransferase family 2 protein [Agrobacterium tumefaciens]WHO23066.1 glycosyltransferase family 2 protein [Agrobacterium tumefaciens]
MKQQPLLSDITVISVCYKSDEVIGDMINAIPEVTPIVLVDNGKSNDFSKIPLNRKIRVLPLEENEGFGRGCNAGATIAETPWLLFLNPDARLQDGALLQLLLATQRYRDAAAFNPRISNSDGSPYFKRRSWLLPQNKYMSRGWPKADCHVPVLSGAALFLSKQNFETIGGFDPNIFLYHEDDDLSLRLQKLGPLMFIHDAAATHTSGHSSGRSPEIARFKAFHMAQSRIYTGKKHGRPFTVSSSLMQAIALFLSPAALFSARRRAKAVGFLKGVLVARRDK